MNLVRILALIAVALSARLSVADAQPTAGAQQQSMDRAATFDRDRVANELSGAQQPLDRRGRLLNPIQVLQAAKSAASKTGLACQVTEAALLGVTADKNDLFEVACQSGPGYIFTSPGKIEPVNCAVVAEQVARMRADGLTPPPGSFCSLKGNQKPSSP